MRCPDPTRWTRLLRHAPLHLACKNLYIPNPAAASSSKPLMSRVSPDTSVDVDVSVSETADRDHHAVGVERRAGDRAGLCGCEEGGVGLDGVDACAVDVEEGEGVCV